MKAECLEYTVWYSLTFEAGEVYDLETELYARLVRSGKFIPAKDVAVEANDDMAVEQPETHEVFEPVATAFEPLPETDDLAKPVRVKPKKHKRK